MVDFGGVSLNWQCICVDSGDPGRDVRFWQEALGWRRTVEEVDEVVLEPPEGSPQDGVSPDILFLDVPEDKHIKSRLHLDLPHDNQAAEVARPEGLGASRKNIGQGEQTFAVMTDPAGNEFCMLRAFHPGGLVNSRR